MHVLDWLVVVAYSLGLAGTAYFVRRAKHIEDFSVASRQIPALMIFATLAATYIGPGYSMGLADKASQQGYIWVLVFLPFCLQTLLVGLFIAPRLQTFQHAHTVGEILEVRYGTATKFLTGILTLALMTGFMSIMARASGELISSVTAMPLTWAAFLSTAIVVTYTSFGGIKGDITSDVFQFIVMSVGVPLMVVLLLVREGGSMITRQVPLNIPDSLPLFKLLPLLLGFFLGEALIPPYTVRALASRNPSAARRGFVLAAIFGGFWFVVCAAIGVLVRVSTREEIGGNVVLYAMRTYLPPGLFGLIFCAFVAIIISSWDSLLNCAATSFQFDLLAATRFSGHASRKALGLARATSLVIGVLATFLALKLPSFVDGLMYCYTLWAPTIVLPLVIGVLMEKPSRNAGPAAIVVGGIATGIWEWGLACPLGAPSLVVGVLFNQLAFWTVHCLSNRSHRAQIDRTIPRTLERV